MQSFRQQMSVAPVVTGRSSQGLSDTCLRAQVGPLVAELEGQV